jgi:hypothetical protein
MTGEEYLRARGWYQGGETWSDSVVLGFAMPLADALAIQCQRDEDCEQFRRSYMAQRVLDQCTAANEAMAKAKAEGKSEAEVRAVGEAVMGGA